MSKLSGMSVIGSCTITGAAPVGPTLKPGAG